MTLISVNLLVLIIDWIARPPSIVFGRFHGTTDSSIALNNSLILINSFYFEVFQTLDGTASAGSDYTSVDVNEIEVPANGEITIDLDINDDEESECTEEFQGMISGPNAGVTNTINIMISDNDCKYIAGLYLCGGVVR